MTKTTSRSRRPERSHDEDLGHHYRSGLERRIGDALKRRGIPFDYETVKVEYEVPKRTSTYTPDFILPNGIIVEAKGRFETRDRHKHIEVKKQHPDMDIRFVFSNPNQRISKTSKTTYAMWCEKHGFEYAKGEIPDDWLT